MPSSGINIGKWLGLVRCIIVSAGKPSYVMFHMFANHVMIMLVAHKPLIPFLKTIGTDEDAYASPRKPCFVDIQVSSVPLYQRALTKIRSFSVRKLPQHRSDFNDELPHVKAFADLSDRCGNCVECVVEELADIHGKHGESRAKYLGWYNKSEFRFEPVEFPRSKDDSH